MLPVIFLVKLCKFTALFKCFKREDDNASWYTCVQCSWWHNMLQGTTAKFKFHQYLFMLGLGPPNLMPANISGYTYIIGYTRWKLLRDWETTREKCLHKVERGWEATREATREKCLPGTSSLVGVFTDLFWYGRVGRYRLNTLPGSDWVAMVRNSCSLHHIHMLGGEGREKM